MKKLHTNHATYVLSGLGVFVTTLALTVLASHGFTPAADSNAETKNVDINLTVGSVMSLAVVDGSDATVSELAMEVTPEAGGVFASAGATIKASTNNANGYTLTLSNNDANTALVNTDATVTTDNTIAAMSSSAIQANFPLDTWGYNFNNAKDTTDTTALLYSAVPALASPVNLIVTTGPSSDSYPFTAAAKISPATRAGTYQDTIVFTLTANT